HGTIKIKKSFSKKDTISYRNTRELAAYKKCSYSSKPNSGLAKIWIAQAYPAEEVRYYGSR
ncbi:hypothetical protein, partial [Vibrio parahaemolyticus]|uniref:hypothetical protein n=1 Tax=Vibrio parahaemolyticus TaxID=670 RepID=UPI001C5E1135